MFVLNTSRPLFRNNPKLRQAVNFAVDRRALARERGASHAARPTDQYLLPVIARLPRRAHLPAQGPRPEARRRSSPRATPGAARLCSTRPTLGSDVARAQILKREPEGDRARGRDQAVPAAGLIFQKIATPGRAVRHRPRRLVRSHRDPVYLNGLFDGRTIGQPEFGNCSYFNSPKYNRLLDAGVAAHRRGALPGLRRARRAALEGRRARDPVRGDQRA